MKLNNAIAATLFAGLAAMATPARAQGPELQFAQAGALLAYAEAEVRLLYASLIAREYDPALTKSLIDELKRTLGDAKTRVDRTSALLDEKDAKLEPELLDLREKIKRIEGSLAKLAANIQEQTAPKAEPAGLESKKTADEDEDDEPPVRDWELLKRGAGWVAVDLEAARGSYAKLTKKLKMPNLVLPPKPKGARD